MKRMVWFDGRTSGMKETILPLVYNMHFEYLLINRDMCEKINPPRKMKLVVEVNKEEDMEGLGEEVIFLSKDLSLLDKIKSKGRLTAYYQVITNQEAMENAWKSGANHDFLVVELIDATNIPLELIIARLQKYNTVLLKKVSSFEEAEISFGVMEVGSDGVLFSSVSIDEIVKMNKYMSKEELGKLELVKGKVVDIQHIGMGNRVCIDTTSIMNKNEGMVIGSTSCGGLLVSSETHYLPYMELRPFRVNAGAVHSYVWAPNGMTNYLMELKGGSRVLCIDTEGNTREVSVGRVKIEVRPLLKIEVEAQNVRINAIVQDDWHIRIFGADGEVRNASTIEKGDELLAYICNGGRHVGVKIDEMLEEA